MEVGDSATFLINRLRTNRDNWPSIAATIMITREGPRLCSAAGLGVVEDDDELDGTNLSMDILITEGKYKAITPLTWRDIPPLAILTGVNGSGKTQFLHILAFKLGKRDPTDRLADDTIHLRIEGENFRNDDVVLVREWGLRSGKHYSVVEMQQFRAKILKEIRENRHHHLKARIEQAAGKRVGDMSDQEVESAFPQDFALLLRDFHLSDILTQIFISYKLAIVEKREEGLSDDTIRNSLGIPPWDVLNSILAASELPYRVVTPEKMRLFDSYQLKLVDSVRGIEIDPNALSSGEQVLMGLAVWLFRARQRRGLPRLLLLDEPDAHLHPSMTRQFLNVIQTVLVEQLGVRVIMTTHSPSTIALAPEGSVFEMRRDGDRIVRAPSRSHAVNLLTAGLVTVSPSTRYVLVEDEMDVEFFTTLWSLLTEKTPSTPSMLPHTPSLVFVRASLGKGGDRVGGGKSLVQGWVVKLGEVGLSPQFQGLIDRDSGNDDSECVRVLSRYSIENYLLDPLCIYTLLVEFRAQPAVEGIAIGIGEEHTIRTLDVDQQQRIVDTILRPVEGLLQSLSPAEQSLVAVEYSNGSVLHYPNWLLERRGKDLLLAFQTQYGGTSRVHHRHLLRSYQRLRMIPLDLRETFKSLQTLD